MIYLFHGEDTFDSYHKAYAKVTKLQQQLQGQLVILNCNEILLDEFLQRIEGITLFGNSQIYFLKRLFQNKNILEYVNDNFDILNQLEIIIWQDNKIPSSNPLYKKTKVLKSLFSFNLPKIFEMKSWVKKQAKKYNLGLGNEEIELLLSRSDYNKWIINLELQKLELIQNKKIPKEKVITSIENFNVWEFLNNFSERNKQKIYKSLNNALATVDTQYLISMIRRELYILTAVSLAKNDIDLKLLKIHPFVLKKAKKHKNLFTLAELYRLYEALLKLDYSIKTGKIKPKLGLILFLQLL
jgi:DNA polymerase-3 subunit delta